MKISINKNNVKWALEQTFIDNEEIIELVWEGEKEYTASSCGKAHGNQ